YGKSSIALTMGSGSLAGIARFYSLRCHLTVGKKCRNLIEIQEVISSKRLVYARGFHRLLLE
ncbi:hypothetical protein, partial [Serratia marcescens]|uniref:hypothetical protein n=1 Tax=Serratia marcescens TaxID=615 RepID=UPI0019538DC7